MEKMSKIETGLRTIKTRSENIHKWKWPCAYLTLIGTLTAPVFPPLGLAAVAGVYLWLFFLYRLAFSHCPRCNKRFYSLLTILFNMSYYTNSGMIAVECQNCKLKLSELPEVEEIVMRSHKDEWMR